MELKLRRFPWRTGRNCSRLSLAIKQLHFNWESARSEVTWYGELLGATHRLERRATGAFVAAVQQRKAQPEQILRQGRIVVARRALRIATPQRCLRQAKGGRHDDRRLLAGYCTSRGVAAPEQSGLSAEEF